MIKKEQEIPVKLLKMEALLRRLLPHHPKWSIIEKDYIKIRAGYNGEKSLSYHLDYLPKKEFQLLYDVRLCNEEKYFQIDSLILSTRFALILEVKNFYGTLLLDSTFNQLIRISENKEEGFPNPIAQAHRQQLELKKWQEKHKLSPLPIEYLVVISNPSTILKTNSTNHGVPQKIIHIQYLLEHVRCLQKQYSREYINHSYLKKWIKTIIKSHTPLRFDPLQYYKLNENEIIKGVFCKECNAVPMKRIHGTWLCNKCKKKDKHAHIQALEDYFQLMSSSITNHQFRDFFYIESIQTASRLLHELNLPYTGMNKGRVYFQSDDVRE